MQVSERVTQYTVNAIDENDGVVDFYAWEITVAYRGHGMWAVTRFSQCLSVEGEWEYEPIPSSRTEDWITAHRFTEQEALALARKAAPNVCVNGLYPVDVLARHGVRPTSPVAD